MTAELLLNKNLPEISMQNLPEGDSLAVEFGWNCLNPVQQASLSALVTNKNILSNASFKTVITTEKLIPDALNHTEKGRKAIKASQIILDVGAEQLGRKFQNPRQQSEKLIKYFRKRAEQNPTLLPDVGNVLNTIAEGDMGILFFPQGENEKTQNAILETWGVIMDVSSLLENGIQVATENSPADTKDNETEGQVGQSYIQAKKRNKCLPVVAAVPIILALATQGCTNDGPDPLEFYESAKETSQAIVDQACNPDIITDVNVCKQLGGPENIGKAPDLQGAVEGIMNQVSMGDPLDSHLPGAIRDAISLYKEFERVNRILATTPSGDEVEVGLNFTEVGFDDQRNIINELVQDANDQGLRTEIEIGPRNTLNPCPPDTICFKIGLENPNATDYRIGDDSSGSFTGLFKMDVNRLAENPDLQGKFNRVYTVSPFPVTDEDSMISIREISESAFELTKEGGEYIVWFNPYFNREFMDLRQAEEMGWPTTEDMYGEVASTLWGQYRTIDYGPLSVLQERYPDLKLPKSEFINEQNQSAVNVLVIKK